MVYLTWNINSLITSQLNFFLQLAALKPTDRGPTVLGSLRTLSLSVKWGSKEQRGRSSGKGASPLLRRWLGQRSHSPRCFAMKRSPRKWEMEIKWERCWNRIHSTGMFSSSEDNQPLIKPNLSRVGQRQKSEADQRRKQLKTQSNESKQAPRAKGLYQDKLKSVLNKNTKTQEQSPSFSIYVLFIDK